ncbi:MAG: hypothetical protein DHS20C18_39520 [Saprospiraceae bacterium]|nr:MAG: hypothetical protein DHS20C18_39520 [Saprospiraceae bacterium]
MEEAKIPLQTIVQTSHSANVLCVAISPDGQYLASGSDHDCAVKIWDLQSGILIRNFAGHGSWVYTMAFSPDGKYLLTGSWDGTAKLWGIETGRCLKTYGGNHAKYAVCFTPDNRLITAGKKVVCLWDSYLPVEAPPGEPIRRFEGHENTILSASLSKDGKYLATASMDKTTKLWEVGTGRCLKTFKHANLVHSVVIDPADHPQYLITAASNKERHMDGGEIQEPPSLKLWDINDLDNAEASREFTGHSGNIYTASISPDGRFLAACGKDKAVYLWDLQNKQENKPLHQYKGHNHKATTVCFSPDGRFLASGGEDKVVKLWDVKQHTEVRTYSGHGAIVYTAAMSPDGKYLLEGSEGNLINLWDLSRGELVGSLNKAQAKRAPRGKIRALDISPDGKRLAWGSTDRNVNLWDLENNKPIKSLVAPHYVSSIRFSEDGKYLAIGAGNLAGYWELETNDPVWIVEEWHKWGMHVDINSEKGYLVVGLDHDGRDHPQDRKDKPDLILVDLKNNNKRYVLYEEGKRIRGIRMSRNGRYLAAACSWAGGIKLWDLENLEDPRWVEDFSASGELIAVDISASGRYILGGSRDNTASLWDRETAVVHKFEGHTSEISVSLSPDEKYVITASHDSTTRIWDALTGKEIAMLVSIGEQDWAVLTPSGLFDASPGAMLRMHYVYGMEVIDLDQLKERYYEPGILSKIMGGAAKHIRKVPPLEEVPLYPSLKKYTIVDNRLQIELEERSGGLGKVSLFINNKQVKEDVNPSDRKTSITVNLEAFKPYFLPGKDQNTITLRLYNKGGWLKSPAHDLSYTADVVSSKGWGDVDVEKLEMEQLPDPWLYAIIVGTSDYKGKDLDLAYPDQDATSLASALGIVGKELFADRLHIQLLTSTTKEAAAFSSKKNIEAAFNRLVDKVKPQDILFVYFSGHGANYNNAGEAQFYYLTHEIGSPIIDDPEVRATGAISTSELTQWLTKIPAQKEVLIFDTCYSGKVLDGLTIGKKSLDSTQERAIDLMQGKTGMYVLAGSSSDKVSFESSRYGQGLLTYSLLWGMKGDALNREDTSRPLVDIMKLFLYSKKKVPSLANDIAQVQEPVLAFPYSDEKFGSFSIGIANSDAQNAIQVAQPKPVVLRSLFQDRDQFLDHLKLSKALDGYFIEVATKKNGAPFIFVNQLDFSNAWKVGGQYFYNKKGEYEVRVKVYKDNTMESDFQLLGKNASELANALGKRIQALVSSNT